LLAKAVAGEAGVPFFAQAGSDFVELYVGVGAKRVRDLFARARKHPAAIVFLDEIDAIGRARSGAGAINGGTDERENTLIALLNELDGFADSRVVVIAATNRVDVLDAALLRPGRLDRKISVPNPDRRGREHILGVHTAGKPLDDDVDLTVVASRTPGFSGAELAFVANEAALEAARRGFDRISASCFAAAVETLAMGRPRRSALVTPRDREITAWHEAGHALVALLDSHAADPVAVSIVPRGSAGGVTWMDGSDDQYLSREKARARLAVALAGRVGEEFLLDGEFTQGAASDLAHATELAGHMVATFGMTRRGLMVRSSNGGLDKDSADVVEELLVQAQDHARSLLEANLPALERLAAALLERESLTAAEIRLVCKGLPLGPVVEEVRAVKPVAAQPVPVVSGFEPVAPEDPSSLWGRARSRFGRRRVHG
jgi:cell division protease FtsH